PFTLALPISPFPVVRIKGTLLPTGARVTLLRVTAPRGAAVRIDCSGRGCPTKTTRATAPLEHVPAFERALPAGVALRVSVTMPGRIGKWTEFTIRRDRAPLRRDRCLWP